MVGGVQGALDLALLHERRRVRRRVSNLRERGEPLREVREVPALPREPPNKSRVAVDSGGRVAEVSTRRGDRRGGLFRRVSRVGEGAGEGAENRLRVFADGVHERRLDDVGQVREALQGDRGHRAARAVDVVHGARQAERLGVGEGESVEEKHRRDRMRRAAILPGAEGAEGARGGVVRGGEVVRAADAARGGARGRARGRGAGGGEVGGGPRDG